MREVSPEFQSSAAADVGESAPSHREVTARDFLPVEAWYERQGGQAVVRIPLRADRVRLEKRSVLTERAVIRRERSEGVATLSTPVYREELRVEPIGDVEVTRPVGPTGQSVAAPSRRRERQPPRAW